MVNSSKKVKVDRYGLQTLIPFHPCFSFLFGVHLGELHEALPLQVAFAPQELDELQGCDFKASKMSYDVTELSCLVI